MLLGVVVLVVVAVVGAAVAAAAVSSHTLWGAQVELRADVLREALAEVCELHGARLAAIMFSPEGPRLQVCGAHAAVVGVRPNARSSRLRAPRGRAG